MPDFGTVIETDKMLTLFPSRVGGVPYWGTDGGASRFQR